VLRLVYGVPVWNEKGRSRISTEVEQQIQDLPRAKKGTLATAKEDGVGSGTVQRIAREMAGGVGPFDVVRAARSSTG
jgi:hypothetical protein